MLGTPGSTTSEFKVAGLAAPILGMLLIALAVFVVKDPELQKQLIEAGKTIATGGSIGYALSRGLAKLGLGNIPGLPVVVDSTATPSAPPATDKAAANTIANQ